MREAHQEWVEEAIRKNTHPKEDMWTKSIAVGSRPYIETTKEALGIRAKGRSLRESGSVYMLREPQVSYAHHFEGKKQGLSEENTYLWREYEEISNE